MSSDQEQLAIQNRLHLAEKAKREYIESKMEETLGLKHDTPVITFDGKQVETLDFVLKEWQRRIEDAVRLAAQNYVQAALKTRKTDMDCFTQQMDKFEEFLSGFQEAIADSLAVAIVASLEEIKANLQKQSVNEPLEREVLLKLEKVLNE